MDHEEDSANDVADSQRHWLHWLVSGVPYAVLALPTNIQEDGHVPTHLVHEAPQDPMTRLLHLRMDGNLLVRSLLVPVPVHHRSQKRVVDCLVRV